MSPALIDSFIQTHNPPKGQISSPLAISSSEISRFNSNSNCQLASSLSMNPYGGQSGFGSSSETRPSFEFNSRVTSNPDPHTPIFSSLSGLSKPRIAKHRKSLHPRPMGGSETRKIDPGFDPFRPVRDNISGVSSRLESDHSVELGSQRTVVVDDDHASISRTTNPFNLKFSSNKVEEVGGGLIDEISKLRIDSKADSHVDNESAKNFNGRGSVGNRLPSELSNELKKLNLASSHGESSKISGAKQDNFGRSREGSLGFSHGQNVGGLFGTPLASELPNDLKKLNLKDTSEVDGRSFGVGASTSSRSDFVFGRNRKNNDTVAPGIASTLPDKIKNLNIGDYDKTNGGQKERHANQSNQTFDSGNSRTGTSSGGVIDPMILDEIENLKIGDHSEASSDHANLNNPSGNTSKKDSEKSNTTEFKSEVREQGKHSSGPEVAEGKSNKGSEPRQPLATST